MYDTFILMSSVSYIDILCKVSFEWGFFPEKKKAGKSEASALVLRVWCMDLTWEFVKMQNLRHHPRPSRSEPVL